MKIKHKILISIYFSLILLPVLIRCNVEKGDNSISTTINDVVVEVQFYDQSTVRVLKMPVGESPSENSYSVIKKPEKIKLNVKKTNGRIYVKSEQLTVSIDRTNGKVSFISLNKNLLLTEKDNGTEFKPVQYPSGETFKVKQSFVLEQNEKIYGLGQIQNGKLVQRNVKIRLANENMKITIPFFQSSKGYGLLWDDYSPVLFSDDKSGTSFESESGNKVDYYFLYGKNADGVVALMRGLTGEAPMIPYWTFGYFQSKERYQSQDETVGVVRKYREMGIPLDGIVQDWQYWGVDNKYWNALEFGNPSFPAPRKMIQEVHDLNARIIISVWPSFGPETKPYKELDSKDMTFGFVTYPPGEGVKVYDVFNQEARDIVWEYMREGIFKYGMDGWWLDATEPDLPGFKKEYYNTMTHDGLYRDVCNAFPINTVEGVYRNQRGLTDEKRVFILTRSASAGQQRYGATSWSGDVVSSWKSLYEQIPAGLNFSLTGLPYWNSDIGGFFTANNYPQGVKSEAYKELYVRWLQFGTFCSMMRSHGTQTPREIYQFGNRGDWAFDAIEKYIKLRYNLIPYIYSASWEITSNASTLMRALMMDFGDDEQALTVNDQFMFGKALMVCPVYEPQYTENISGAKPNFSSTGERNVYLPSKTTWYDFWTNEKYKGGQSITKKTPIDIIPLYVKAGSILPFSQPIQHTSQKTDTLEIKIYPGDNGHYTLYEDEGDGYNYENGTYSTIRFSYDDKRATLTIDERKGSFPGILNERVLKITTVNSDKGSSHSKENIVVYDGQKQVLELN